MKPKNLSLPPCLSINDSELFKVVFNQQFQFMAILSPEGRVLEVNELALTSQGVTRADYIGKLFWQSPAWCNFPEWEEIWKDRLTEASNSKKPVITEDIFQIEDGSVHYADAATTAIYTPESNQLAGYIVQAIDTTKRRLIEQEIKNNEERLTFVLEHSHIGHWELNLIDYTAHRSLKHDQIFGYDSLLPHWSYEIFLEHVLPEDKASVDNKFKKAIDTQTDWNFECRIIRKDGATRWILASGGHVFTSKGKAKSMSGIVQDITEVKQAEIDKLRHSAELESLFKALPDTYFCMMPDGTIVDYQAQNAEDLYIKPKDFLGKRMQDVLPQNIGELFQTKINEILHSDEPLVFKYELIINNKVAFFDARLNKVPLTNQLICVVRDVTEQNYLYERLEKAQKQAKLGSWERTFNSKNEEQLWSTEVYNILEFDLEATISFQHFIERVHPNDRNKLISAFNSSIKEKTQHYLEYRLCFPDGRIKYLIEHADHTYDNNQTHILTVGTIQDVTERKKYEERLLLSSRVFSDTQEGIIITDSQQRIVDINPAFTRITGYSRDEIIGKSPKILSSGRQSSSFYSLMWQSITKLGYWQGEVWNKTKQGEFYAELLNISSLKNAQNEVTHYVGIFSDITHSKQQQEQLNLMAHYDVLTKLPNRALFVDRFQQSIAHSIRTGNQLAICFLDLDDFKPVNDGYGHEVGDRLLIEVAERITSAIRDEDTVSRQGGDEFAILLNDIKSTSQYEKTMFRIHQALAKPYIIDNVQHNITASSGVTLYPSDNSDIDTLLRHADHAMYQSKLLGKHRTQLYSPDSDLRIIEKNIQRDEIAQALRKSEFQLYYQPKVNMLTGEVFGAEALIRWIHPERGLIPPLNFLPIVADTPLEINIGEFVINQALQQLDDWQKQGINLEVSVNISSNHLLSSSFILQLGQSLAEHPLVPPKNLQLEVLESSALGDINTINTIIATCQNELGVNFSLDDFGTGYSSLTHLRSLPVDTIKIDQSFVRDMLDDASDFSIIDGVIALSKSFDRDVIAEGVESTSHGLMLLHMGCTKAQGYKIAKPMPPTYFETWLNSYIPNKTWLHFAATHYSHKENSLEILKIINKRWQTKFKEAVLSSHSNSDSWPILNCQLCHCNSWINKKRQERLFKKKSIKRLMQVHDKTHILANTIKHKYQSGNIESARALLTQLDLLFKEMHTATVLCE